MRRYFRAGRPAGHLSQVPQRGRHAGTETTRSVRHPHGMSAVQLVPAATRRLHDQADSGGCHRPSISHVSPHHIFHIDSPFFNLVYVVLIRIRLGSFVNNTILYRALTLCECQQFNNHHLIKRQIDG